MNLELAIVLSCAERGCRVGFLETADGSLETAYSRSLVRYGIDVRPGDLVAVDRALDPPQTCFRWALATIERVETRVYTDRHTGAQSPVQGLGEAIASGDQVFATQDRVFDLCIDGLPADPDRLRREALPEVEAMLLSLDPGQATLPGETAGNATTVDKLPATIKRTDAPQTVEYVTAETERGKQAIQDVMQRSYGADLDGVPAAWAIARLVDGIPVSFILVDPDRELDLGKGVPYAFVNDVATREDRRMEGHFRALMEHSYERVRQAGMPLLLLHGRYPLYRRLGFEVFTHHCGVFIAPEQVERALGAGQTAGGRSLLAVEDSRWGQEDLLIVSEVKARSLEERKATLLAAAEIAREQGKARILFEHPPAPCASRYRAYETLETPFTALARTCGAEVRVQGADPEGSTIPDADWIKVLDAAGLVKSALERPPERGIALPEGAVALETDAGAVTIASQGGQVSVEEGLQPGAPVLQWPSPALAQLATGYRSAEVLGMLHHIEMPPEALALLEALFPGRWRLSRNESWTFKG